MDFVPAGCKELSPILPASQVDEMHLRHRLGRHVVLVEAGLYEGYRENCVTPTADVVHVCAGRCSVRVSSNHAFLKISQIHADLHDYPYIDRALPQVHILYIFPRSRRIVYIFMLVHESSELYLYELHSLKCIDLKLR